MQSVASSCSGKWSLATSDVNRGPGHCQSGTALIFPVLCLAYTRIVESQIDGAVRAYEHAHDDHYLTRSKFNSLLTEMITPQTRPRYIYIKPLPRILYLVYSGLAQARPELIMMVDRVHVQRLVCA